MQRGALQGYQQLLGAIGRYLDQHLYEDVLLCELADGFVGRVLLDGRLVAAIPFQSSDIAGMVRAGSDEPARPANNPSPADGHSSSFLRRILGSYRDFLTALGHQLDQVEATSIVIAELADSVLVVYRRLLGPYDSGSAAACEFLYDEGGVRKLMQDGAASLRS